MILICTTSSNSTATRGIFCVMQALSLCSACPYYVLRMTFHTPCFTNRRSEIPDNRVMLSECSNSNYPNALTAHLCNLPFIH